MRSGVGMALFSDQPTRLRNATGRTGQPMVAAMVGRLPMPSPRLLACALAAVALGLVACNQDTVATRCRPVPTPSPPVAGAGQLTATSDAAIVPTGGSVDATVTVAGPLDYQAPCEGPLSLIVIDRTDIHVDSLAPPAPKGTP